MKLFRFLKSRTFFANIVLAGLALWLIFLGVSYFLDSYTLHGENKVVPNLQKMAIPEAADLLAEKNLGFIIIDSAEFFPAFPRGSVIEQYPAAGAKVKEGREIRLTLNPVKPRKIEIPNVIEKTKRRAIYDIESKGFIIGELQYVPYIGKDVVVDIKVEGRSIKLGESFTKGTIIDLILGEGLGNTLVRSPYLRWMTAEEAKEELLSRSLNLGSVIYDEEITDSATALVYKQVPSPSLDEKVKLGSELDIWLTNDYTKIPDDSLMFQLTSPDSLFIDSTVNDSTY